MSRSFQIFLVLVILVVVWSMRLQRVGPPSSKTMRTATMTEIAEFSTALSMYKVDCGRYPTTEEGLAALIQRPPAFPAAQWRRPYLDRDKIPIDPWRRQYIYKFPGLHNTNTFDVYSLGPNGKGGDEAIGNWPRTNQ